MTEHEQGASKSNVNDDTLIFAHVIFRHGQRNIAKPYPNDPYNNEQEHWPEGYGQLTNVGKLQLFKLGQYFRRRYDDLIGKKYSPYKIYTQSTNFDRTIVSAQACLAGLYPPIDEEIWNENLPWQPIPIHSIPEKYDHVLKHPIHFPEYRMAREKFLEESPEVQRFFNEHAELIKYWSHMSGAELKTIENICYLYDALIVENEQNKPLADWAIKAIEPEGVMESIVKFSFKIGSYTKELSKLRPGSLIKEIIERFEQKINSTLNRECSLYLYSAHDYTISNVLNCLGIFELHRPPYACSVHFELYKTSENEHYLQIFYRKSNEEYLLPLSVPGCGEKYTLNQFRDSYKEIIPDDNSSDE